MPGIVIITAEADVALVNRLLLYIRDWEFGDDPSDSDRFAVLESRQDIIGFENENEFITQPPIQEFNNEWTGLSMEEVEKIMLENDKEENGRTSLFLLLDEEGVKNQTIIVVSRAHNDPNEAKFAYVDEFNKVRVPWEATYSMWCNLDIANMDFEEFCSDDEQREMHDTNIKRRWWTYKNFMKPGYYDEYKAQAEQAIKELKKLDLA